MSFKEVKNTYHFSGGLINFMKTYNSIGGGTLSEYGNLVNDFLHLILIPTSFFNEFGGIVRSGLFVNCSTHCRVLPPGNEQISKPETWKNYSAGVIFILAP